MSGFDESERFWTVILAGGDGERLRPFVQRWLGRSLAKQYCTFVGTRSLFQHTVDRCDRLVPPERRVSVIARSHRADAWPQWGRRHPGRVLLQPRNCGTAAGLFYALAHIRSADSEATVAVFPSDHFIHPEDNFLDQVLRARRASEMLGDRVVVLAAAPDGPESEYGWIVPGATLLGDAGAFSACRAFLEKPGRSATQWALESGGLWSTMVLVGRAEALWQLGSDLVPDVVCPFERYAESIGTDQDAEALESVYSSLPACDLSAHVLERAPARLAVSRLSGIRWSDWGALDRIVASIRWLGREPAFPPELLDGPDGLAAASGAEVDSMRRDAALP